MDLGIAGRRALVCAASKGLGRGCAEALAREGVEVTICARTEEEVARTADEIAQLAGRPVAYVVCDITTPEGREKALAACPQPDILVNNAGGPPPGDFRDWDRAAWLRALDANMLTPIELVKATVLTRDGRGLLHFIGRNQPRRLSRWIRKRVFPGAYAPVLGEVFGDILEPGNFSVLDVENLRLHYALTLRHWRERYEAHAAEVTARYGPWFARTWRMYLAGSEAAFATGSLQLFQVLFARGETNRVPWIRDWLAAGPKSA